MSARRAWSCALLSGLLVFARSSTALAQSGAACVKAAEEAQSLRDAGHLRASLDKLVRCSAEDCPLVVRKDCISWMDQVEKSLSSVIVHATDGRGKDVIGVRVIVDGTVVRERLDGRELVLDPGEHRFRLEVHGAAPLAQDVLLSQGERNRILRVQFDAPLGTNGEPVTRPDEHVAPATDVRGIAGYGLLGLGGAALVGFGLLEIVAQGEYRTLRDGCGTTRACSSEDLSSTQTKFDLAKVALGVGVVSLGVGTVLLLTRKNDPGPRASVSAAPIAGGGALRWRLVF